jgi:hypothetical protein
VKWGDAPTWVAAIGTVGAFGCSLYLLWQAIQLRIRDQARLVSAWIAGDPETWRTGYAIRVSNRSDEAVYNFRALLQTSSGQHEVHSSKYVPSRQGATRTFYETPGLPPPESENIDGLVVEFTDASGRAWQRDVHGHLKRRG